MALTTEPTLCGANDIRGSRLRKAWCLARTGKASRLPPAKGADGVAVGADEVALAELLIELTRQPAPRECREVADLLRTGPVIERHRRRVESFAAIHARCGLQVPHARDETPLPFGALPLPKLACRRVIKRVPGATAGLAPPLMALGPSMELAERLLNAAQGAAPQRGYCVFVVHPSTIEQAFDGDKMPVGACRGGEI